MTLFESAEIARSSTAALTAVTTETASQTRCPCALVSVARMEDDSAEEPLADTLRLRRRARSDRHAYRFPLLFFGLAIVGSAPLYVEHVDLQFDEDPNRCPRSGRTRGCRVRTVVLRAGAPVTRGATGGEDAGSASRAGSGRRWPPRRW